jgi:hypothetical protein
MSLVFLDPFIDRIKDALDNLGEVGETDVRAVWRGEYHRVRRQHVGEAVREIMARCNLSNEQFALELGGAGAPFACEAKHGKISLEKFQLMVDVYAPGEFLLPPSSERFAPATMKAMEFVREHLAESVEQQIDREVFEYVTRATRCREWFVAREEDDQPALRTIAVQMCRKIQKIVEEPKIADLANLDRIIDEWSVAYLVCVSYIRALDGEK